MRLQRLIFLVITLMLFAGCSGKQEAGPQTIPSGSEAPQTGAGQNQAGRDAGGDRVLSIDPPEAYRGTVLRAYAGVPIPAGAAIEWIVNGSVAKGGGPTFDTSGLRKGDTVQVKLSGGGLAPSRIVTLRNSPPEIRGIRFVLGEGAQGNSIGVEVETFDADGDPVQVDVQWRNNGAPAGLGNRLEVPVKRGDKIDVTVTPFDGAERGKSATLYRDIRNTPPVIEGQEQFRVDGNIVTFRVRASDADGDRITYAVKDAPTGMQIDRESGWVRWETVPGTTGKFPFTVTVSDGSGGEATARFNVTVAEQPPAAAK